MSEDIRSVGRISAGVLLGGRVMERGELDGMLARARTAFSGARR